MRESYVRGGVTPALLEKTIGRALDDAAALWGAREALVCPAQGVRLSWQALKSRAEDLAAGLLARGLKPGDRVGIWSLNRVEWVLTQFACAKAGLILTTVNPAYRLSELEYALNKVGMSALIIAPPFKTSDYPGMIAALAPELDGCAPGQLRAARLPTLRLVVQMGETPRPGTLAFAALEQEGRAAGGALLAAISPTLRAQDPINIQFTSGTTGAPKGVTLSHRNILNNGYLVGRGMALTEADRICIPVPLYHCFGMVMGNLAAVTSGAAMVLPGEGFDPLTTLQTAADERCTALYGVPTMFIAELDHPRFTSFDLSAMRTGIMAGSPCPIEVMRKVISQMHARDMTICYGMTETSPVSFQTGLDDTLARRVSTVGRVQAHLEVKIIGADGAIVPINTPGELCTRGYSVMLGYWDDAEQTAKAVQEGWMHTGDLATLDEEGFCQIVGRIKDMVIRGGENLYPREIEEYLYKHPKILDVQVFGVPDPLYGEELCAWVILREGETMTAEELRAFCQDQIAHHKIPRHVKFVDEMPKTVTGKIQKFKMREQMIAELAALIAASR
ncbi:AMP-binding protein [Acidocella sp.]|uniref:AMP-binding protein n=1 Tax=Acidocella sp. TaxID=50710 RepID=UPI00262068EA|nr:AMP-binding protein [Acidocella sp.]